MAVEIEFAVLRLMFRVEVPRLVLSVGHPDHDSEEDRDDRHAREYIVVGPRPPLCRMQSVRPVNRVRKSLLICSDARSAV